MTSLKIKEWMVFQNCAKGGMKEPKERHGTPKYHHSEFNILAQTQDFPDYKPKSNHQEKHNAVH